MILTADEIRLLLAELAYATVVPPSTEFPYRISRHVGGYSEDGPVARLQAKLSIMLQVVTERAT